MWLQDEAEGVKEDGEHELVAHGGDAGGRLRGAAGGLVVQLHVSAGAVRAEPGRPWAGLRAQIQPSNTAQVRFSW